MTTVNEGLGVNGVSITSASSQGVEMDIVRALKDIVRALKEFRRQSPPVFKGSPDLVAAKHWLRRIEKIFNTMKITGDENRVRLATYLLEDEEDYWWSMATKKLDISLLSWKSFKALFLKKFFPEVIRVGKIREFLNLKQGNMSIMQFKEKFNELSQYVPNMTEDDSEKTRFFEWRLIPSIRGKIVVLRLAVYSDIVEAALVVERKMEDSRDIKEYRNS